MAKNEDGESSTGLEVNGKTWILEKLTVDELRALLVEVNGEGASIKAKISEVSRKAFVTGERSDPEWFTRINSARVAFSKMSQLIQLEVRKRKAASLTEKTITEVPAGLSLRDWFAGMALRDIQCGPYVERREVAKLAYGTADAMLAERGK
jgi:hypothetical protein